MVRRVISRGDIEQFLQVPNGELFSSPFLLFADNFVVNGFFDGLVCDESMNKGLAGLADAMNSPDRLKFFVGL